MVFSTPGSMSKVIILCRVDTPVEFHPSRLTGRKHDHERQEVKPYVFVWPSDICSCVARLNARGSFTSLKGFRPPPEPKTTIEPPPS